MYALTILQLTVGLVDLEDGHAHVHVFLGPLAAHIFLVHL